MTRTLLCLLIGLLSAGMYAQPGNFKIIQKKSSGNGSPGTLTGRIMGHKQIPAYAANAFSVKRTLAFPGFMGSDLPKVIRKNDSPIYIEKEVTPLKSASGATFEDRFFEFMEESKAITRLSDPRESFKITDIHTDGLGITHVKTIQQYHGVEIYGSESTLHIDAHKERFTGSIPDVQQDIAVEPVINDAKGLEIAIKDVGEITHFRELSQDEKKLLHYESPTGTLVLYRKADKQYALVWLITIRPNFLEEWKYFVDAKNGEIIRKYNNTNSDGPTTGTGLDLNNVSRTFNVYLDQGTYALYDAAETMYNSVKGEGVIVTLDANNTSTSKLNYSYVTSTNNTWTQKAAISAHYNASRAFSYFKNKFGRNSINGQGGNIISFVNVREDDGSSMENAFWNGQAVFYGNGGTIFKPLAGALDVAAHELGHGVISNTANLEYTGQSGAMNESYADIFGSMVDRDDWLIGEDITNVSFSPSGALRSMSDPHNQGDKTKPYWQPRHVSEMYLGSQDNGGVHINSGIGNYAYYLFATAVGKDKAEQVYYRALTEYLTKTSQFIDWRIAVIQSAKDLYGSSAQEAIKAADAFDAVGVYDEAPVNDTPDYSPNPGQQHLLIYNTDINYTPTLYTSPETGTSFKPLSSTVMKGKVSVTDDGISGVFVGSDDKIYVINLDPANPNEHTLSNEAFFDNVAVSKDGNRLAAISTKIDTAIYVYDFGLAVWKKFRLYNPTTSDKNINAGGVLYADAIEFDPTGEYLIYDAYNELTSTQATDISYWDVGFMKVWDLNNNTFGDGSVMKLFTSLPENVSVGNPVFSKTSPNIIAFDYFYDDGVNQEYRIYCANLETGDLVQILGNSMLGYPTFSKNDDTLAYTSSEIAGQKDVYTIPLKADRISPNGPGSLLIEFSKWPVFYAIGTRSLELAPVANFTADYKTGDAPLKVRFVDLSGNNPDQWLWTFQGGSPASSSVQNPEITYNIPGTYRVTLKAVNSSGNNTIIKNGYIIVTGATAVGTNETAVAGFYPNPVKDKLMIVCDNDFEVRIMDLDGKVILAAKNEPWLDVSALKSGVYILELKTTTGISRHKLVKE